MANRNSLYFIQNWTFFVLYVIFFIGGKKMLDNNYLNMYQTDFYKKEVEFFRANQDTEGLADFEQKFALANALYTESKKCIGFSGSDPKNVAMSVIDNSDVITAILSSDPSVFEVLRDAEGVEKTVRPGKRLTSLAAAIIVCREHLNMVKQNSGGMHR